MKELETRFYTLDEINKEVSVKKHSNSKRDVEKKLENNGYTFEWFKCKGVQIINRELTPEMRLKLLLIDRIGLDTQVNALDYARFITAFSAIDGFSSMPWEERVHLLVDFCGKDISLSTVRRWTDKLVESGNAAKFRRGVLWHTKRDQYDVKHRKRVDPDSEEYRTYCAERADKLLLMEKQGMPVKERWGTMIQQLYKEMGVYYYCSAICLNALGDDIEEITLLVQEILEEQNTSIYSSTIS